MMAQNTRPLDQEVEKLATSKPYVATRLRVQFKRTSLMSEGVLVRFPVFVTDIHEIGSRKEM